MFMQKIKEIWNSNIWGKIGLLIILAAFLRLLGILVGVLLQ